MPFYVVRQDIIDMEVGAIVNPTQSEPIIGGSTDLHINKAAGVELLRERKTFGLLHTAQAIITKGYNLTAKYVIHTVGPTYIDGKSQEKELLMKTYQNCLNLASENNIESIAFPLISSGHFRFPKGLALDIAIQAFKVFLEEHDMVIYLVVYDNESYQLSKNRLYDVKSYIFQNMHNDYNIESYSMFEPLDDRNIISQKRSLKDTLKEVDETFTQKLFRFIKQKNLDDVEVYKNANMTRQHFSKIRSDDYYQPKKETAISLAIGLKLNLDETKDLLQSCGFALSQSSYFDLIIQYFIEHEIYDLYEINLVLYENDQKQLGAI
jgi:O-acetyl-ADP-ribose deacetylase (regulator of RNase III)